MTKKKLGGFLAALGVAAAAIVATKTPHHETTIAPTAAQLAMWDSTCHAIWQEELGRAIDPGGLEGCIAQAKAGGTADTIRATVDASPEHAAYLERLAHPPAPPAPEAMPLSPLATSGHVFVVDGRPWRWIGFSSFALLDRFARGEDISDTLTAYRGYNIARVWPYVPAADWGARAWDSPAPPVVVAFLQRMEAAGFYVELTLLTDDAPARIDQARQLVAALKAARPPNLVLEVGNEPTTHKAINTGALKADVLASGFLVSSGNYEDTRLFYGQWIGFHSGRDAEWPRRAHDAIDYWSGGGPDFPEEPAVRVPSVCDEPIRPDQAGYVVQDFRAYFGSCAVMAAGFTVHTETGKWGQPPTPDEARIVAAALDVAGAFPADAPNGSYRRIDEGGRSLRTYVIGEHAMVRVRPTSPEAPEGGWTALDPQGILWHR